MSQSFDLVAEQIAANVIGMVMRRERAHDLHAILACGVNQPTYIPRGVDDHTFIRRSIADEVAEVEHLLSDRVGRGEVTACEKLFEVETITHGST
jgi:hypothetical protein